MAFAILLIPHDFVTHKGDSRGIFMRNINRYFRSTTGALLATTAILGVATAAYGQTAPEYGQTVSEPDPDQLNVAQGENITGAQSGLLSRRRGLTVNNAGTIRGNGTRDDRNSVPAGGISIDEGDNVINNSGTISGAGFGITTLYYVGAPGGPLEPRAVNSSVNNSGLIVGAFNDGIRLIGGGSVINSRTITGGANLTGGLSLADGISMFFLDGQNGAMRTGIGNVTNQIGGMISGDRFGIILSGGGVVDNAGTLRGNVAGLLIQAAPQNPLTGIGTVTNSGTIIGADGLRFGGTLNAASLSNSGSITGTGEYGIASRASGPVTIENSATGTITGAQSGILSEGAALTINNSGSIRGNGTRNNLNTVPAAGISIAVGDNIVNNSGLISGAGFGITTLFYKNPVTGVLEPRATNTIINNTGSIIGDSSQGVRLNGGGTITNSGTISGRGGALADGLGMSAFNGQDMFGRSGIGTVINQAGGKISGARIGVIFSGGGTVDNAGSIIGATLSTSGLRGLGAAVVIQSSAADGARIGLVNNSGQLQAGVGFMTAGFLPAATLNNSGTVIGLAGPGVFNLAGGIVTVNNGVGGSITGATSGIYGEEGAVIVTNDGLIRGNGNYDGFARAPDAGIGLVQSGSSVVNRGIISSAGAGITTASYFNAVANRLEGRAVNTAVTNSGTISGESNDGVRLIGGGTLTNSGTISGSGGPLADGVSMFFFDDQNASGLTGVGTVSNAAGGTISGDRFGIILSGGGSINNAGSLRGNVAGALIQPSPLNGATAVGAITNSGSITGADGLRFGAGLSGASLSNSGSIVGSGGYGVNHGTGILLTLSNVAGGNITGHKNGVFALNGALALNNAGTIRANLAGGGGAEPFYAAVLIGRAGTTVTNSGVISSAGRGIATSLVSDEAGGFIMDARGIAVTNSGTITGESDDAVSLLGGGSVVNSGRIYGLVGAEADGLQIQFANGQATDAAPKQSGTIINLAGGQIVGARYGAIIAGGGTVQNAGLIEGGVTGLLIVDQARTGTVGSLVNTGTIFGGVMMDVDSGSAYNSGSIISSTGTAFKSVQAISLTNAGRIASGAGTAVEFGGGNDSLLLTNGSLIEGIVDGGLGLDTATLDADAASVLDLGPFVNFENLIVDGGTWRASGATGSFDAIGVLDGQLIVTGSLAGSLFTSGTGVFEIGNGGTSGSFTGDLHNDGAFVFNRTDNFDFVGDFSGNGIFTKLGAGTVAFLGTYGFSGTTRLRAGGIRIAGALSPDTKFELSGGTLDLSGSSGTTIAELSGTENATIVLGGMADLTINQESNTTFAGNISGDGSLIKTGDGRLNLTGNSTYTGETIIGGGILSVNGSVISDITIQSGAVLGGTGTTGDVTIQQGGAFNPGNSIGTIKVVGGLVFARGSAYQVEVDANGLADRITVVGSVKINDGVTVNVLAANGNYRDSTKYLILTATDKMSGHFSAVSTDLALLDAKLVHSSKKVELLLKRNDISFAKIAKNNNQVNVANAVEALGQTNPVYDGITSQNVQGAQNAFGILSGSFFGDLSNRLVSSGGSLQSALLAAPDQVAQGINSWSAFGRSNKALGSLGYQSGVSFKRDGLTASFASGFISAERIAYGASGDADMTTNFVGGNIDYASSGFKANAGVGFGWHDIEVRRNVIFSGFGEGVDARFKASTRQMFGELSYAHANGSLLLQPYAGVSTVHLKTNMINEVGGSSSLRADLRDRSITTGAAGLRASAHYKLASNILIAPRIDFGWQQSLGDLSAMSQSRFGRSGTNFAIEGERLNRGGMKIDAGLAITMGPVSLSASYRQTSAFDAIDDGAKLTLGVRF